MCITTYIWHIHISVCIYTPKSACQGELPFSLPWTLLPLMVIEIGRTVLFDLVVEDEDGG